jgi:hypothetical protein
MSLQQEVDGSGKAESGKKKKQDQVHRSAAYGLKPAQDNRRVGISGDSVRANPLRL